MNEKSVVQVQIYDRSVEEEMFLGMTEIRPRLVNGYTIDQWFSYALPSRATASVAAELTRRVSFCAGSLPEQTSSSPARYAFRSDTRSSTYVPLPNARGRPRGTR